MSDMNADSHPTSQSLLFGKEILLPSSYTLQNEVILLTLAMDRSERDLWRAMCRISG